MPGLCSGWRDGQPRPGCPNPWSNLTGDCRGRSKLLDDADRKQLQVFVKHWLRQTGRTPADLGQALGLPSATLPKLLDQLVRTHGKLGTSGLVERLCRINEQWQCARSFDPDPDILEDQLDLLLEAIRSEPD